MRFITVILVAGALWVCSDVASAENRMEIKPLTVSEWGQQAPFFYDTPTVDGQHCKTGCVATAVSQLVYYHGYPNKGKYDVYSYQSGVHGELSFDFRTNEFDYSLMKPVYDRTEGPDDPSAAEVSKLMKAAGITVNMSYGLTESSGQFGRVSAVFREWLLYPDEGVKQLSRDYFTNDEWESLVYDELAAGRPVIYMGGNGSSSHVFLCDGYKDGKFHMNWGWYGECNGYFSLTNLETYVPSQGKVWSLNSTQNIVRGIHGPDAVTPSPLATASDFSYSNGTFTLSGVTVGSQGLAANIGVKAIDAEGNERLFWAKDEVVLSRTSKAIEFTLPAFNLEDGSYTLRPVFRTVNGDDNFYCIFCNLFNNRYVTARIVNGAIESAVGGTDAEVNVSITDFRPNSPLIYGDVYNRSFTVLAENTGNVNVTRIKQWFYEPGTETRIQANENNAPVSVTAGSIQRVTLALPSNLLPGTYDMQLADSNNNPLGGRIRIVYYNIADAVTFDGSPFRFLALDGGLTGETYNITDENIGEAVMLRPATTPFTVAPQLVIPSSVEIKGKTWQVTEIGPNLVADHKEIKTLFIPSTVKNIPGGAFNGCTSITEITVEATIPPSIAARTFDEATKAGATVRVPEGTLADYQADEQWSQFANLVESNSGSMSGIENVLSGDSDADLELYSLWGVKVAVAKSLSGVSLAPGVYIAVKGSQRQKIVIR